nr:hypothetical protein [Propionibacterium sp.]
MPITTLEETTSQKRLRIFAAIAAAIATLQTVVAITMIALHGEFLVRLHEGLGYLYVAAAVVTVVPAVVWGRLSHKPGLIGHAAGLAVAGVVQLLLGLFQAGGVLGYVHMALGLLIMVGAIALYVLAKKRPIIVTNLDGTPRA